MPFSIVPRSFFGFIPIQVGAEIVAACAVLNKVSALYGLGALFTGHKLTAMQWVMNLVSAAVIPLVIWGYFSVLNRRPLKTLLYTHFYVIDTMVSLGFTIYFIVYWFTVAGKPSNNPPQEQTRQLLNKQKVRGQETTQQVAASQSLDKSMTVGQELAMTIVATTIFLLVRTYFMLVLIGNARVLVRKSNLKPRNGQPSGSWASTIQYTLLAPFEHFWTGHHVVRGRSRSFGPAETDRLDDSS